MVQIITDTSTLFTIEEGKQKNIHVIPLCVTLGSEQYRDLCFDTNVIYQKIQEGITPSTSQPPLGDILDAYEAYPEDEIINICMADGLSGSKGTPGPHHRDHAAHALLRRQGAKGKKR